MEINEAKNRIKELIEILNNASKAYYSGSKNIMSDFEYDKLYDELKELEDKFAIYFSNSPTQNVGYEVLDNLPKERHIKPMLSLNKTKNREELKDFLGDKEGILSYKMDGLTVVLTYENGNFIKGVTRGNGETGEVITSNCKAFVNLPLKISYKGKLTLRGEAIITYSDFNKINETNIESIKYKNPRNLCSGSVRQLDSRITKERKVKIFIFSLVDYDENIEISDYDLEKSYKDRLSFVHSLGFDIVFYKEVNKNNILDVIEWFANDVKTSDNPSDGLVLIYNDLSYEKSLGTTSKFPRNQLAFKWKDEVATTTLKKIEWSPSRTGLINPIAVFDSVELEGTTVKRASLHNISIMEDLKLGIGDKINVYKANMIIPQISENLTKSNKIDIIEICPSCGMKTTIKNENDVKTLVCENPNCPIKHIKSFENFASRNCMNFEGISIATIETFISNGYIKEFSDIYKLEKYKNEIINLDGFGEKSYENIINSINEKKEIELYRLINSLGINGVGTATAKTLAKTFNNDVNLFLNTTITDLQDINDIGPIIAKNICDYLNDDKNKKIISDLLLVVKIKDDKTNTIKKLDNMNFVITGSLNNYNNRDELVKVIEDNGGKVLSSVSKNVDFLINNDINSNSSKNKKAKELNIKIITENDFTELL